MSVSNISSHEGYVSKLTDDDLAYIEKLRQHGEIQRGKLRGYIRYDVQSDNFDIMMQAAADEGDAAFIHWLKSQQIIAVKQGEGAVVTVPEYIFFRPHGVLAISGYRRDLHKAAYMQLNDGLYLESMITDSGIQRLDRIPTQVGKKTNVLPLRY